VIKYWFIGCFIFAIGLVIAAAVSFNFGNMHFGNTFSGGATAGLLIILFIDIYK
jgi:hypothetical protein